MLYTLYPCKTDGASQTFDVVELSGDQSARDEAERMLADHSSCAYVAVWLGDRPVLTVHRRGPGRDLGRRAA